MIVNKKEDDVLSSNMALGETVGFSIDESSMDLVMEILSKLYAHPIRTLVQEYICNGRDAMREAGTWGKRPIEISVPNRLEPSFKVRDYGVGISPDRMSKIFVKYGSSTKRDSNLQTGGFGIGSKSFRCYTDSMSVTSFIDGIKYTYIIQPKGVLPLAQEKTTEANGVEISMGVKSSDIADFHNAVRRCVKYWAEPIIFHGVTQGDIEQVPSHLTLGNLTVYKSQEDRGTFYLIDGIKYDLLANELSNSYNHNYATINLQSSGYSVAINLPNGSLKIASSRERIENTQPNKDSEAKLLEASKQNLASLIKKIILAPSISVSEMIELRQKFECFALVKSISIPLGGGFALDNGILRTPTRTTQRIKKTSRRGKVTFEESDYVNINIENAVICDTSNDKELNTLSKRANHYLDTSKGKVLVMLDGLDKIPHAKLIFTNIVNSETLPKPVPKARVTGVAKSARESFVYFVNSAGSNTQCNVERFNNSADKFVSVEEVTPEVLEAAKHLQIVKIPKCNKDIVTKKTMSLDAGKKYLVDKNRKGVVGLTNYYVGYDKLDILKGINRRSLDLTNDTTNYILKLEPSLAKEQKDLETRYYNILAKYPLIKVLHKMSLYDDSVKILVDAINTQTKGKV